MKVARVKLGNKKVMSSNLKKEGNYLIIQSKLLFKGKLLKVQYDMI